MKWFLLYWIIAARATHIGNVGPLTYDACEAAIRSLKTQWGQTESGGICIPDQVPPQPPSGMQVR